MIEPPRLPDDNPDYVFECEQALDRALSDLSNAAIQIGWHDAAVDAALRRLIQNRVFGPIDGDHRELPWAPDRLPSAKLN